MFPMWYWPLFEGPAVLPDVPGLFGAVRKHDIHTGIDLYTYPGMSVHAVEDGVVVGVEDFTGSKAGSPWWNDTQALLVEGSSGVVVYGEVSVDQNLMPGVGILRGDRLGEVRTVLRKDKGRPMTMLHLELMCHGARETLWWRLNEPKPTTLLDPTRYLVEALEERRKAWHTT